MVQDAEAEAAFQEGIDILEKLAAEVGESIEILSGLSALYERMAHVAYRTGRRDSKAWLDGAERILERLRQAAPDYAEFDKRLNAVRWLRELRDAQESEKGKAG